MGSITEDVMGKIRNLPDTDKLKLVDAILEQLDRPDPDLDAIWAQEASRRWVAYKEGKLDAQSYEAVMARYRKK
jgi:putative addiction module component (TIGR02574 family)